MAPLTGSASTRSVDGLAAENGVCGPRREGDTSQSPGGVLRSIVRHIFIVLLIAVATSAWGTPASASRVADCPPGYTNNGLTCGRGSDDYSQPSRTADCPSGYTNNGLTCGRGSDDYSQASRTADCPAGYTNVGLLCTRGTDDYSQPSRTADCPAGYTNMGLYCGKGLSTKGPGSMTCRPGEFRTGVRCYENCRDGYTNMGETCHRPVSTLGPDRMTCRPDEFKTGVRCYRNCRDGYTNMGETCHRPVSTLGPDAMTCRPDEFRTGVRCYKDCRDGYTNMGETCHRPVSTLGESAMTCGPGEVLNFGRCHDPAGPGESCWAGSPCGEGFGCEPLIHKCLPDGLDLSVEAYCSAFKVDDLSTAAVDAGITMSYGNGSMGTFGVAGSQDVGTVYGENGEFGCYASHCYGGVTDLSISTYAVFGFYTGWDTFAGVSRSITEGASFPIIEAGFSTAQVIDTEGTLIGTTDSVSIGVGLLPVQAGLLKCVTHVIDGNEGLAELEAALDAGETTAVVTPPDAPPAQVIAGTDGVESLRERAQKGLDAAAPVVGSTAPCAEEGGRCVFAGTRAVFYGSGQRWTLREETDGVDCNSAVFGDPAPGSAKVCHATSRCAAEGETCHFAGERTVLYGSGSTWVSKEHRGGAACTNGVFGDPTPGVVKECFVTDVLDPDSVVTIYRDARFQGPSQTLAVGGYDGAQITIGGDQLSSLRVPAGYTVTLYRHVGFTGRKVVKTRDTRSLACFDNEVSSIIVSR